MPNYERVLKIRLKNLRTIRTMIIKEIDMADPSTKTELHSALEYIDRAIAHTQNRKYE